MAKELPVTILVRTQLMLRGDQRVELDKIAEQSNSSISEVVRKFVDAQLRQQKYEHMQTAATLLRSEYLKGGNLDMSDLDNEVFVDG
jgi:hypothetical protein